MVVAKKRYYHLYSHCSFCPEEAAETEYASSAAQYQRLKDSLAKQEIQSVIDTTEHGAERLMSRGFTPSE